MSANPFGAESTSSSPPEKKKKKKVQQTPPLLASMGGSSSDSPKLGTDQETASLAAGTRQRKATNSVGASDDSETRIDISDIGENQTPRSNGLRKKAPPKVQPEVLTYIDPGKNPRPIKMKEIKRLFAEAHSKILSPSASKVIDLRTSVLVNQESMPPDRTYWLDIQNPTLETLAELALMFEIHPLTVEDCLTQPSSASNNSRQKHELFKNYRFITYSEVHYLPGSNVLNSVDVNIIVFPNVVITTHHGHINCINHAAKRACDKKHGEYPSADWVMYAIMDAICDNFFVLVEGLVSEIATLDEMVLILTGGEQTDFLMRIGVARKRLMFLRTQLIKKRDIVHALVLSDTSVAAPTNLFTIQLGKDIKIYLRDVLDHLFTMLDEIENSRETLGNLNNTYLARVSIEVAEVSNNMNEIMKKLNAVTVLFLPLGVVAGLWGMNVPVPGQIMGEGETAPFPTWFLVIVGAMILFCVVAMYFFKRLKWF